MRSVTLIGNDGTPLDLSRAPFELAANPALWGMPPVATHASVLLGAAGSRHTGSRFVSRPVQAGLWVQARTAVLLDAALATLARLLNPVVGPCRLVVDRGDGEAREVTVHYSSGFEGITVRDRNRARAYVPLVFVAHEPYWRAVEQIEYDILAGEFIGGGEPTPFDDPSILFNADVPFDGFNAAGLQTFYVDLAGDVEAWPRWNITGPATVLTAYNITTGKLWSYEPGLTTGARFVLDTAPTVRTVAVDDVNVFAGLSDDSELWPLVPGRNHLGLRVQDWSAGTSEMLLSWRERFLTC